MKLSNKVVESIKHIGAKKDSKYGALEHILGWIALVAIEELLKSIIRKSGRTDDNILRMDGNADNYIELNDFLERNPQLKNAADPMSSEVYMLIYVAKRLLKYGS